MVPVSAAGKAAQCPNCQAIVPVPLYFPAKRIAAKPAAQPAASYSNYAAPMQGASPAGASYNPPDPLAAYTQTSSSYSPRKSTSRSSRASRPSSDSGGGLRILLYAFVGIGVLFVCGMLLVVGLSLGGSGKGVAASSSLSTASTPVPQLPELRVASPIPGTKSTFQFLQINQGRGPGQTMQFRVYLPATQSPPKSIPCVLLAPAGTNLLHGNLLDADDYHDEALPYCEAGMAVVCFSIDGPMSVDESAGERQYMLALAEAFKQFNAAQAGVVNARNALEFALTKLPQVDPNKIFIAGHSSAATLALLTAAQESRLKGAIAFAPVTDLNLRLEGITDEPAVARVMPGIREYLRDGSPINHVDHFKCRLFVFHAHDDSNEPFAHTKRFIDRLSEKSTNFDFEIVNFGDHYDSMIQNGIPKAVAWIQRQ